MQARARSARCRRSLERELRSFARLEKGRLTRIGAVIATSPPGSFSDLPGAYLKPLVGTTADAGMGAAMPAFLSMISRNGLMMSIGIGKMIVEFLSLPTSLSVCR